MQYRNNKHEHMSYSTREKLYNNMQGFMVEADGCTASQLLGNLGKPVTLETPSFMKFVK
jgi:hypothetical protein